MDASFFGRDDAGELLFDRDASALGLRDCERWEDSGAGLLAVGFNAVDLSDFEAGVIDLDSFRGADAVPPPDTAGTGITSRHAGQRILFPAALSGAFKVFLQLEQITIMEGAMLTQDKMIADQ